MPAHQRNNWPIMSAQSPIRPKEEYQVDNPGRERMKGGNDDVCGGSVICCRVKETGEARRSFTIMRNINQIPNH